MNDISKWLGLASAAAVSLAACGGGGGDTTGTSAPAAAVDTSTIDSFLAYQKSQPAAEVIDPATLQKQLAAVDDTAEPTPLTP